MALLVLPEFACAVRDIFSVCGSAVVSVYSDSAWTVGPRRRVGGLPCDALDALCPDGAQAVDSTHALRVFARRRRVFLLDCALWHTTCRSLDFISGVMIRH